MERLERPWRKAPIPERPGWEEQEALLPDLQPGGKRQPRSGAGPSASVKGDGTGDIFLISAKTSGKQALRLERSAVDEILTQASVVGKHAAVFAGFDAQAQKRLPRLDLLALERHVARRLIFIAHAVLQGDMETARAQAELLRSDT